MDTSVIDALTKQRIKTDLLPVIRRKDGFNLEREKEAVKTYLAELMVLTKDEREFMCRFAQKEYVPELLFSDADILERIKNHPMALWKTR